MIRRLLIGGLASAFVVCAIVAQAKVRRVKSQVASCATNATQQTAFTLNAVGNLHRYQLIVSGTAAPTSTVMVLDEDGSVLISNAAFTGTELISTNVVFTGLTVNTFGANTTGVTVQLNILFSDDP